MRMHMHGLPNVALQKVSHGDFYNEWPCSVAHEWFASIVVLVEELHREACYCSFLSYLHDVHGEMHL
jgi:hypothetical protein